MWDTFWFRQHGSGSGGTGQDIYHTVRGNYNVKYIVSKAKLITYKSLDLIKVKYLPKKVLNVAYIRDNKRITYIKPKQIKISLSCK